MTFFDFLFGKNESSPNNIQLLQSNEFLIAVLDKQVQLIDVRTPKEYNSEHIKGALNVDWFQPFKFKKSIRKLNKEEAVYMYCRSGNRSQKAAKELAKIGFEKIYDLQGGINSLKD
ncbi:MAG: rhodanese-like domain-containing protein [Maribacter sp.]